MCAYSIDHHFRLFFFAFSDFFIFSKVRNQTFCFRNFTFFERETMQNNTKHVEEGKRRVKPTFVKLCVHQIFHGFSSNARMAQHFSERGNLFRHFQKSSDFFELPSGDLCHISKLFFRDANDFDSKISTSNVKGVTK